MLASVALASLLAGVLLSLAQCTMVGDRLTGVDGISGSGPTTCIKACNDFYAVEYKTEQKKHLEEVAKCQALPQPDKNDCLNAESIRHSTTKDALGIAKVDCQNACSHTQGTGSAG